MHTMRNAAAALAAGLLLSLAALAAHGKAGLWEVTTRNNMGGMPSMPDMSSLPPQVQAQLKARGVRMNGSEIATRFCMTADQVASDHPVLTHNAECKAQNVKFEGSTFNADIVCTGKLKGTGHVQITFSSPVHYLGSETMDMTEPGGTPMHTTMAMDARWLSPNCGNVK